LHCNNATLLITYWEGHFKCPLNKDLTADRHRTVTSIARVGVDGICIYPV